MASQVFNRPRVFNMEKAWMLKKSAAAFAASELGVNTCLNN